MSAPGLASGAGPAEMRRHRLRLSLRARLALWYLLALGLILLLFGSGIYVEIRNSLLDGMDSALQVRAETVASQSSVGPQGLRYQPGDAPRAEAETAVYLFNARGQLQDRVAGSTELPPRPSVLQRALNGTDGYWATVDGQRLYMASLRENAGQGRVIGAVQVTQSLDVVNNQLKRLLLALLVGAPALLALATVVGVFLAGRALAPIDRITRTAREIGAGNLTGRLELAPRDDEVGRLAATFDLMLDRLEHAFAHQENAVTQQRQFTADASHELRTPLTIIKGDLDVLLRRGRSAEEYEDVVRGVNDEVTRLSHLVEDLLTLARADSGQAEVAREFIYLDSLVDNVTASLSRVATSKGIVLSTSLEQDVAIIGDGARLRRLILNLLDNAVKYTPVGGRVQVRLGVTENRARLEIADTGIGIAPDDLPHIFDRFFRADKARTRTGGSGLGLAIARWTAEAHGGSIDARCPATGGSIFTVALPLVPRL